MDGETDRHEGSADRPMYGQTDRQTDRQTDGWKERQTDREREEQMDGGWIDRRIDIWRDGQTVEQMDRQNGWMERQIDMKDGQTDQCMDRQTDRQTRTDGWTDKNRWMEGQTAEEQMDGGWIDRRIDVATWKSDISSKVSFLRQYIAKQVIPVTWKHTLERQDLFFVTVLKDCSSYDLSEDDLDNVDVIVEIIDEFIFNGGKELSALQELQLLEILCSHFQGQSDEVARCLQFGTMFNLSPEDELKEFRCKMLAKLVSMSVALECSAVLECVAVWIQKHRYSLQDVLNLTQSVVDDYCVLVPTSLNSLESLVRHSALLASQFLTAVTLIHPMHEQHAQVADQSMNIDKNLAENKTFLPPRSLLKLVANWITSEPSISLTTYPQHLIMLPNCRTLQSDSDIPAPSGGLAVSPVPGLIRWSILGPVCFMKEHFSPSDEQRKSIMLVFSQLQFGVLQTFLTAKKQMDEKGQDCEIEPGEVMEEELDYRSLVTVNDLKNICEELLDAASTLPSEVSIDCKTEIINTAVDRLAQIIQVAETTGCLSGTKAEFGESYPNLPRTRLLNLVLQSGC